ncbi:hypothetical protein L6452_35490 [Arctium lappa]|uniref:Uncharacterized protein n=1 Tax=Arctium lappa TaxID=4217 RepID=A0ACB8Y7D8_ARCLA|nr:hypothetical protein L6452_35490 [Arctium lappa]
MSTSLTSSLSSTFSSAPLHRSSLLPTHQPPNSLSLRKPNTTFPSIRAQSSEKTGGDSKVEKAVEEIKDISINTLKEESEKVNEDVTDMNEKIVEKIGKDTNKAVDTAKAVNEEILDGAKDAADKTTERVGEIWDAATGKS